MKNNGFTLIEILAVVAILGVLVIMIMPGIMTVRKNVLQ